MKKSFFFLPIVITLVVLIGCQSSRTPITANEFTVKAETVGYTIQDAANQFPEGSVENYLIAFKGTDTIDYKIEFAVLPTVEQTINAYAENRNTFESKKGTASVYSSVSMGNYSYYTLTTDNKYYVISRIENTFIYVDVSAEYKDEIVKFLQDIGY